MPNTMQQIVKKVFADFGRSKPVERDYVKESIALELKKLERLQKKAKLTSANEDYAKAGFKAETLTSIMVQKQIAAGA